MVKAEVKDRMMNELFLDDGHHAAAQVPPAEISALKPTIVAERSGEPGDALTGEALLEALRTEAYSWPRLIFRPLKKAGHIILDGCTAEGD